MGSHGSGGAMEVIAYRNGYAVLFIIESLIERLSGLMDKRKPPVRFELTVIIACKHHA